MDGRASPASGFVTLGMNLVKYGGGRAVMEMETGEKYYNPMGTFHGGLIADLADAAMGNALISTLGQDETFLTVELKMNFLHPVYSEKIRAEGIILHKGKTLAVAQGFVTNEAGKDVAVGTATLMIISTKKNSPVRNHSR